MPGEPRVKPEALMRMATFYLARHSASAERLRQVLSRMILRRLADPDTEPPDADALRAMIDPIVDRLLRSGLLDDAMFARGRAASLAAKGRPAWRIKAELAQHGVDLETVDVSATIDGLDPLVQAATWARRRRLGPFRLRDRERYRERDIASLARAGYPVSIARRVVDAEDPDSLTPGPTDP